MRHYWTIPLALTLMVGTAWADPSDEEAPAEEETAQDETDQEESPGTIRVRGVTETEDKVLREWEKVTRSLLDLEDEVIRALDRETGKLGIEPGEAIVIRLEEGGRVKVEVIETSRRQATLQMNVEDEQGEPEVVQRAYVVPPEGSEAPIRTITPADSGEIVIENLDVAEGAAVQLFMGDGDVVVLWVDEGGATAVEPTEEEPASEEGTP